MSQRTMRGDTALVTAIVNGLGESGGQADVCRGADRSVIAEQGQTALHVAALRGNVDRMERSVERGAAVNARDVWGGQRCAVQCSATSFSLHSCPSEEAAWSSRRAGC